jgi:phytoene desaturase
MKLKAAVIGSGVGGLATAIRLAVRGHDVDVFEKAPGPGGKLGEIKWNGYRWDTGPSLFTLPDLVEELFLLAGEELKVSARVRQLDVITRYFYPDGTMLNAYGDPERFAKEVEEKTGEPAKNVLSYLDKTRTMYDLTRDVFIFSSFSNLSTFYSAKFLKALMQAWKLDAMATMHGSNRRRFRSSRLVQLFDRYATYNGSNPYKAPGTLNMISHLEHNLGAYFPEKGMHVLAQELYKLAGRLGVRFHFNTPVTGVEFNQTVARGIHTPDGFFKSDIVVSDIDIYYLYKDLLPEQFNLPKKYMEAERSTSAMIFYWAIDREFPELELHNVFFSGNYSEEFKHLFTHKTIYEDPTVYLFISRKVVEGDAPEGGENWFVMINVPENNGQDWDDEIARTRENILRKLSAQLHTDIRPHILHEEVGDPRSIEQKTSSWKGSLYGNSSNNKMSAFSRHPNYRRGIHGLYFVGGSVHPGGGIPLCIASAKIVDHHIQKVYRI